MSLHFRTFITFRTSYYTCAFNTPASLSFTFHPVFCAAFPLHCENTGLSYTTLGWLELELVQGCSMCIVFPIFVEFRFVLANRMLVIPAHVKTQTVTFTQVSSSTGSAIFRAVLQKLYPSLPFICWWRAHWIFKGLAYTRGMVLLLVRGWIRTVGIQGSPKGMGITNCSPRWLTAWERPKHQVHWFSDCHDKCDQVAEGGCEIQHKLPWVPLYCIITQPSSWVDWDRKSTLSDRMIAGLIFSKLVIRQILCQTVNLQFKNGRPSSIPEAFEENIFCPYLMKLLKKSILSLPFTMEVCHYMFKLFEKSTRWCWYK